VSRRHPGYITPETSALSVSFSEPQSRTLKQNRTEQKAKSSNHTVTIKNGTSSDV